MEILSLFFGARKRGFAAGQDRWEIGASRSAPIEARANFQREEIVNLQFLRGLAATLVVADHLLERLVNRGALPESMRDVAWALGEIGVATFFAISGFIMVYTTCDQFGRPRAAMRFMTRRVARVVPLYYVTTAAMILFALVVERSAPNMLDLLKSVAFIPYAGATGLIQPIYALGWTLEYEMFFYLLFALFLRLPFQAGTISIVSLLLLLVGIGVSMKADPSTGVAVAAYFFTRPVMLYFAIGILVAALHLAAGPIALRAPLNAALCMSALAILVLVALRWASVRNSLFDLPAVAASLLLVTMFKSASPPSRFSALSTRAGQVSYSLYLTHSFLLGLVASALAYTIMPRAPIIGLVVGLGSACAVGFSAAWLTWKYVEQPLGLAVNRLLRGPAMRAAFVSPAPYPPSPSAEAG